jgi:hypothetical protein
LAFPKGREKYRKKVREAFLVCREKDPVEAKKS